MRFQAEQQVLVNVLQKIQGITGKKASMPVLSQVLLVAQEDRQLVLSATDLDLSLRTSAEVSLEEPGQTTVSAKKLLEIVREVNAEKLTFFLNPSNRLEVLAGRSQFELATIPAEDFPFFNIADDAATVSFEAQVLRNALIRTLFAIPADDDPFSVPGLFCEVQTDGEIRFIASDGHRLAYDQVDLPKFDQLGLDRGIIIPRKGVAELVRILEKEERARIGLKEDRLLVKVANTVLSIQLLEEEFPQYRSIVPEQPPNGFLINREQLFLALKRLAVFTDQNWKHVCLQLRGGRLELSSGNPELGQASDEVDVVEHRGEPLSMSFNIRYVMEAIQLLDSDMIRFEWLDELHGGIFTEPDNADYLSLIMPMLV